MAASEASFLFSIIGGPALLYIRNINTFESLSKPFVAQIQLASLADVKDYDSLIGRESLLTIFNDYDNTGNTDRYFHGILRKLAYIGSDGNYFLYEAEIVPKFWQLSLRKNCRIFQDKTTVEIIDKIFEEGGIDLDLYRFDMMNESCERGFCVQYNESDFDFISRLLEEEGNYYYFEHYQDKHVLVICDDKSMHSPIKSNNTLSINPGGMEADEECISSFTFSQKMQSGEFTHRNFNFKNTSLDLTTTQNAPNNETFEVYEYPAIHSTQARGSELANVRSEELAAMQKKGHGETTSCRLIPGFTFTLADHISEVLNQDYLITTTVYAGEQPQSLEESNIDSFSFDVEFTVIPASVQYRPMRTKERPFIKGIQTAIVVGPKGEEIHTDEHGRVRVQFHWDREGENDQKSSCWLRVAQAWGGGGFGAQFIPRIGDEVLVDFIEGNPDRPIITGSVYNGDNLPINSLDKSKTQSGFRTKTHKGEGFNELRFDDATGAQEVYLQSEKDFNVLVKGSRTETVYINKAESIGVAKELSIGAGYAITVGGAMNTGVGLGQFEEVGLNKTVLVGKNFNITAGDSFSITCGKSKFTMDKAGNVTISGSKFELSAPEYIKITSKDIDID